MTKTKFWLSILAISVVLIAGSLAVSPIAIAQDEDAMPMSPDASIEIINLPEDIMIKILQTKETSIVIIVENIGTETGTITLDISNTSPGNKNLNDDDKDGWPNALEEITGSLIDDKSSTPEATQIPGTCNDKIDNDGDGFIDENDAGCVPQGQDACLSSASSVIGEFNFNISNELNEGSNNLFASEINVTPLQTTGKDVIIDSAHGRGGNYDWSDIEKKAKAKGFTAETNNAATPSEIKKHLIGLNSDDIWIFEGHAVDLTENGVLDADGLSAKSGIFGWGDSITITEKTLKKWLSQDNNPPGFVLLSSCKSVDLFPDFKAAGVKVVVGFTTSLSGSAAVGAEKILLAELFAGTTLNAALIEANNFLKELDDKLANENMARLQTDGTLDNAGTKTLVNILNAVVTPKTLTNPLEVLPNQVEADSDGDGIEDEVDVCIFEKENFNGIADGDGCPEADPGSHTKFLPEWCLQGLPDLTTLETKVDSNFDITTSAQLIIDFVLPGESIEFVLCKNIQGFGVGSNTDFFTATVSVEGDPDLSNNNKFGAFTVSVEPPPPRCDVPSIGLMDIISSCVISSDATAPENVIVRSGAIMTIESGVTFDINFSNFNLTVKSGGSVLIESGGTIT